MTLTLIPFTALDALQVAQAAALWNAACGSDLAVSEHFMRFNLQAGAGVAPAARLALVDGEPAGFALANVLSSDASASPPEQGYLDALAVHPAFRRRGVGSALLDWAADWFVAQGCTTHRLGGGLRPFAPGLPASLGSGAFFRKRGYALADERGPVWDVARDLRGYPPPRRDGGTHVAPAGPQQASDLLAFLRREFGGRWRYEFEAFLAAGGRISDYLLLWDRGTVEGFCRLTFEDSLIPLDRFYPWRLPRPWGQLGPIGVSAARRGQGLGAALLEAGLQHLAAHGVAGCVIDWTHLVDFYAKFGFEPYRAYDILIKTHA